MTPRIVPAVVVALVAFVAATPAVAGDSPHPVELHGLRLTPPIPLSAPAPAGLDALVVVHPPDAKSGGEKLSLTAVAFPKDSGMTDADLLAYVKMTFLATTAPGKPVEKTLLGKTVKGESLEKKIPTPSLAQVYVATKRNGDKVVLGFVFSPGFAKEAEEAIAGIASSLTE